jgi:hypothetical protein
MTENIGVFVSLQIIIIILSVYYRESVFNVKKI